MLSTRYLRIFVPVLLALQIKATAPENMDSKALSAAVAKFSAKFCNELDKDKSVVSSPLSAEYVLALLTLGSTNDVHTELLESLGIPDDTSIRSAFTEVSTKLKAIKGVTLNVANKVYIMEGGYDLNPQLKEDAITVFDAGMEKVDFSQSVAAANLINKWVEDKTNSRIKDLIASDSLDSSTRLVLVNALYFKGTWKRQFEPRMTTPRPFHINENTKVDVPMMFIEAEFNYGVSEELGAQILKMSYVEDEASMVIVLPNEINGLDGVLRKLASGHDLMQEVDRLRSGKVEVFVPKFKIETTIDLNELLPKLGIKEIFNKSNTGLNNMLTSGEPLFVSKAVQKAFIEVNEEGAEAAAATVMGIAFCSAILNAEPVPRFVADRPFLVAVVGQGVLHFLATNRGDVY